MNNETPRTEAALVDNADLHDWGHGKSNMVPADFARELERELNGLKAWKTAAMAVLSDWENVWEAAGKPGTVGMSKAECVKYYIRGNVK
jgi:hypothetical protein